MEIWDRMVQRARRHAGEVYPCKLADADAADGRAVAVFRVITERRLFICGVVLKPGDLTKTNLEHLFRMFEKNEVMGLLL